MRDYAKVSPQFWIGKTGKSLRREGLLAQLVALYLITSSHANMIGFYYLPRSYIAHDTGLSMEDVERGLQGCIASGLCLYDDASDVVWVCEMARIQIAEELKPRDKRIAHVQGAYDHLPANALLLAFYERYGEALLMTCARSNDGKRSPFEGASKGLRSQEQEQEQKQEQEQEQEQDIYTSAVPSEGHRANSKKIKTRPQAVMLTKKSLLPEGFGISDELRRWAKERQIGNLELHLENFISAVRRHGYTYVDWDEAFKEAIRKNWAKLDMQANADGVPESVSKLGKAGRATAINAQRWLEQSDADN